MVNFGGHFRAIRDGETKGTDLYLVPYNVIKRSFIYENQADFEQEWKKALEAASNDFSRAMHRFWRDVFGAIAKLSDADESTVRGAPPKAALQLFLGAEGPDVAHEMLQRLTQIHTTALTNSEGLRKLVKKYDKVMDLSQDHLLSTKLLPLLYSTNPHIGQSNLEDTICILRALLELEEEQEQSSFVSIARHDSETAHAQANKHRMEELHWLKALAQSIPSNLIGHLVAHRGFHHIKDRNDRRPIENSLAAFELAWTSGVHLCECDIALTKDEVLVLAHDEDFQRLALDSSAVKSNTRVSDLTFKELISLPLKSGVRPPLLIDVLRSAHAISDNAKLVIEIKPGNSAAASALSRMLLRHADLRSSVAMIMSFDAVTMHRLRAELYSVEVEESTISKSPPLMQASSHLHLINSGQLGSHHRRLKSYDHFGILASSPSLTQFPKRADSFTAGGGSIGLSLSQTALDQSHFHDSGTHFDTKAQQRPTSSHSALGGEEKDHTEITDHHTVTTMPKLMLLTVCEKPKKYCEMQVSVDDLSPVDGWLTKPQWSLDGVYLQFQEEMLTEKGVANVRNLNERGFDIGVWGHSGKDPDDYFTFERLVNTTGVSFVNTDLPTNFRESIGRKVVFPYK